MRLLANENVPRSAVKALRRAGYDVAWTRTDTPGDRDEAILARARNEQRVVLTFDKDFGELAYRARLPAASGVILFRMGLSSPEQVAQRVLAVLNSHKDWQGQFAEADESRIRVRSLPGD